MVANADGSDPRAVTPVPLVDVTGGDWSADGRILLLVSLIDGRQSMSIIDVEQRTMRTLDVGMPVREATFQPQNDEAIAFIGEGADGDGLYLMDRDGREPPRPLVSASSSKALARFLSTPAFSPDGSRIAYVLGDELVHRVHIIDADGTGDLAFEHPPGVLYQNYPTWSPDGTELLVSRTHAGGPPFEAAILPADGSGIGRVVGPELSSGRAAFSWSPDGASVVVTFEPVEVGEPARAALVIDAVDGTYRDLPTTESWLVWQRVAP
jgi:Tol biopolymer transport system component